MTTGKEILNTLKDIAILLLITILAGGLLGLVYKITVDPIAEARVRARMEACMEVLPGATEFTEDESGLSGKAEALFAGSEYEGITIDSVYEGSDESGAVCGYVVSVTNGESYGGDLTLFIGFNPEADITGISVIENNDTPGLGQRAGSELTPQFVGKGSQVGTFTYVKNNPISDSEVVAISGATITTKAVTNEINAAMWFYKDVILGGDASGN